MIDDSEPNSWTRAKGLDLRQLSSHQLHAPELIERLREWHDLPTMADARNMIAKECKRRTVQTHG